MTFRLRTVRKGRAVASALAAIALTMFLTAATADGTQPDHAATRPANDLPSFSHGKVVVDGQPVHYVVGGSGPPLVLLHGWPETWWEWRLVMPGLAARHTVIAFDLPGLGDSGVQQGGYDKATTARRIRDAVHQLGFTQVGLVGHDVGALVAYPYARDYPSEVTRLVAIETPLSGFGLEDLYGRSWHFLFNIAPAPIPERIIDNDDVATYLDVIHSFAVHRDAIDTRTYVKAYSDPAKRSAGYEYYRAFEADAADNRANAAAKRLTQPVIGMGGQFSFGPGVAGSFSQVADDVRTVVAPDAGHYVPEENPQFLVSCLALFFGPAGVPAPSAELAGCAA